MDMLQAKKVIAHFLKVEASEINETTVMNYTVIPSSLLLHRMYSVLADKGYVWKTLLQLLPIVISKRLIR